MEIKILKTLEKTPTIGSLTNRGMSVSEITSLEQKYNGGKQLPQAFREFLFLAGKFWSGGLETGDWDYLQEGGRRNLQDTGFAINRPFFVFDHLNDCEQFGFFYLDELNEDPVMYNCFPYYVKHGSELIERMKDFTLSSLVNEAIRRRVNNISF